MAKTEKIIGLVFFIVGISVVCVGVPCAITAYVGMSRQGGMEQEARIVAATVLGFTLLFGGIFGGVGFFLYRSVRKVELRQKRLLEEGRRVQAVLVSADYNFCKAVNGRHPMVLICEYEDVFTGQIHVFKSDDVWEAFDFRSDEPNAYQVDVYVNPSDWTDYYVDPTPLKRVAGIGTYQM